ncbi:Uncharacterised protein [Mycobacteroides abscessus subsp. abscessus]|nr:Uncharacterised protein [Mycobacteroides abscessus subsp. abscessus]
MTPFTRPAQWSSTSPFSSLTGTSGADVPALLFTSAKLRTMSAAPSGSTTALTSRNAIAARVNSNFVATHVAHAGVLRISLVVPSSSFLSIGYRAYNAQASCKPSARFARMYR